MRERNLVPVASERGPQRRQRAIDEHNPQPTTYYGRPMLKKPTWRWYIPLYFFLGGVAGGTALVGAAAECFGGARHRATVRNARYLALPLSLASAGLLITDLGRPARFHHMLRVFKGSSPLNMGTWILSGFGALSGVLLVRQAAEDGLPLVRRGSTLGRLARRLPTRPLAVLHGLFGLALGGYTGTLLAATAVPLWNSQGILLGPLFLADAVTSGAAALSLVGALGGRDTVRARAELEDVDTLGTIAQLGVVLTRELLVPAQVQKPLRQGRWGLLWQGGAVGLGMVTPLAVRLGLRVGGWRPGRALTVATSALSLLGALAERFALTEAGKRSAEDPLAYQEVTKGAPGEARATPGQQAKYAPDAPKHRGQVAVSDC